MNIEKIEAPTRENFSAQRPQQAQPMENEHRESSTPMGRGEDHGEGERLNEGEDGLEFSRRFAGLRKQDKELRERGNRIKEKEEVLNQFESFKSNPRENATKILDYFGLSFNDLADIMLADTPEENPLEAKVNSLAEKLESREREDEESRAKQQEENRAQYVEMATGKIADYVEQKGEEFELIRATKSYQLVFEVIEEYEKENGEMPKIDDVLRNVENHIYEQHKPLMSASKFRGEDRSRQSPQQESRRPASESIPATQATESQNKRQRFKPTLGADMPASSVAYEHDFQAERRARRARAAARLFKQN